MKLAAKWFALSIAVLCVCFSCSKTAVIHSNGYQYEVVKGDPLNARVYTLDNGLTIYLTVYKDAPRIQTCVPVRVGSKYDPPDNTGLAHYLEHLLFKGSDEFGTRDFEQEKPLLDEITRLYEVHKAENDSLKRLKIYQQIDSVSYQASKYAIAAEYDKMMAVIGTRGTNAFTSNDYTCYINDIPSNKIKQWLEIESERFRDPVFRIFHTELEVVYEEKNRAMDNDDRKRYQALMSALYPVHPYGQQTTLGKVEHLKNPSIQAVYDYFNTYYVPNNMALCLSGDFDPDSVIVMIDETFGTLESKSVPPWSVPEEKNIQSPVEKEVLGPDMESVLIGYRFPGAGTRDAELLLISDYIMMNSVAGIIDLNLKQKQKVIQPYSSTQIQTDYAMHYFGGRPREGQRLEDVRDLLLAQIDSLKAGAFPDWLPGAVVRNLKLDELRGYERNSNRAFEMVDAFIQKQAWEDVVAKWDFRYKVSKQDIVDFAQKYYGENYVVVFKRRGQDSHVLKIQKPPITPVELNRDAQSDFMKKIAAMASPEIQPEFLDFEKDVEKYTLTEAIPVWYKGNTENDLFTLVYLQDRGRDHDPVLALAVEYLSYLGTGQYTAEALKQEMYRLGCSFNAWSNRDQVGIRLNGLSESFQQGVQLFEHLLAEAQPDEAALDNLIQDILKRRNDAKLNKRTILRSAMYNYALYGEDSPYRNILSEEEMRSYKAENLIDMIHDLTGYPHRILYYGPLASNALLDELKQNHAMAEPLKTLPEPVVYTQLPTEHTQIFVCNYDMKQAEVMMLSMGEAYNRQNRAMRTLFNEYYGGNMSSVVFQTLRESKALAYSVWGAYRTPGRPDEAHYVQTYIGTQADKIGEALDGMYALLTDMPETENSFEDSKTSIISRIQTERITKSAVLWRYEEAVKWGNDDYDHRRDVYAQVPEIEMRDLRQFFEQKVQGRDYTILVLGDVNQLDFNILKRYGQVKQLSLEEVFGY